MNTNRPAQSHHNQTFKKETKNIENCKRQEKHCMSSIVNKDYQQLCHQKFRVQKKVIDITKQQQQKIQAKPPIQQN